MITVILPAFNDEKYIHNSIKSILNQTFKNFQFLIINDGSTDNTEKIILSFDDPRIIYKKKEHTGLSDTLNYGLSIAQTELIARMDSDDLSHPERLEKQYLFFRRIPGDKIISCWSAYFKKNNISFIINDKLESSTIKKNLLLHSYISHPGAFFSKSVVINNGGYKGEVFEDYDLWLRIRNKVNFYIMPEVLIFQRIRKDSLSRENYFKKQKIHYAIQVPYYSNNINDFGIENIFETIKFCGWREYFYGCRRNAIKNWTKLGWKYFLDLRILIATIIMFLPENYFLKFKELRLRYRLNYLIKYTSRENKLLRYEFFKIANKNYIL